jgi:hypothetical protein
MASGTSGPPNTIRKPRYRASAPIHRERRRRAELLRHGEVHTHGLDFKSVLPLLIEDVPESESLTEPRASASGQALYLETSGS